MKTTLLLLVLISTSCSLTVDTNGSRHWKLNGEQVARAVIIISEK